MNMKLFKDTFMRMYRNSTYRIWLWVLGFFTVLFTFITYKSKKGKDAFAGVKAKVKEARLLQKKIAIINIVARSIFVRPSSL